MAAEISINKPTIFSPFHAQYFYYFGKKVLYTHHDLHDSMDRWKAKDGVDPVSID